MIKIPQVSSSARPGRSGTLQLLYTFVAYKSESNSQEDSFEFLQTGQEAPAAQPTLMALPSSSSLSYTEAVSKPV